MNLSDLTRRLLDPLGGDRLDHPRRQLRLNLRRVERIAAFEICSTVYEGAFSFQRSIPGMLPFCILLGTLCLVFLLLARHGQRHDAAALRWLPEAFVVSLLLMVQVAAYLFAHGGRLATGYAFTYLICAAFFLIPPRRFSLIGLCTLLLYAGLIATLPFSLNDRIANLANTTLIVAVAMLARWGLHRLEQVNAQQGRQIAAQNAALAEANRRLVARNAELNTLMAIAAHDLRSPLLGLRNLLELVATRPPESGEDWREIIREAGGSVGTMLGLIGRILEAHEAETEIGRDRTPRDLRDAADEAIRRAGATADRAGIHLCVAVAPARVPALVDPAALDRILDNLLSNAIRFSPSGTQVEVRVGQDPAPFIDVSDRGVGIPPAQRDELFGKFRRGPLPPLHGPHGSGLGLYIVRTLAEGMGARSSYREGDGGGSVFRVAFDDGAAFAVTVPEGDVEWSARGRAGGMRSSARPSMPLRESGIADDGPPDPIGNLFEPLPDATAAEVFADLLRRPGCRIERIVSQGQTTPVDRPYRQDHDEWVLVLTGRAVLEVAGRATTLAPGDHLLIACGSPHRVTFTDPDRPTVWLAIHFGEATAETLSS